MAGVAGVLALAFVACVGDGPPVVAVPTDAAPGTDAPVADTSPGLDSGIDVADVAVPPTYFDVTDPNNWSSYDLTDPGAFGPTTRAFGGGVLAGKYMYLDPAPGASGNGVMFRYDTTAPFKTKGSWTTYDLKVAVDPGGGYGGAVFDGANVLVVPYVTGKVVRFDTTQSFVDVNAWKAYSITSLSADALSGHAFDGQYFYVSSYSTTSTVLRYDTKGAGFQNAGAWTSYGLSAVDPALAYLSTPAFDKRYLYFSNADSGKITRFDTKSAFNVASSWDIFDSHSVSASMKGTYGGIFDGQYIYFPSYHYDTSSVTLRYDTTKPFAQKSSWDTFDLAQVDAQALNFLGGTFDGRYVYYTPFYPGTVLVRYDTTLPFGQKASWQSFGLAGATANVTAYCGIVFDGEYVYLVPQAPTGSGAVTIPRFHARTPRAVPTFTASFQ